MYHDIQTRVKTRCDTTSYFDIEVGLHQGAALNPLLLIIVMDVLLKNVNPTQETTERREGDITYILILAVLT